MKKIKFKSLQIFTFFSSLERNHKLITYASLLFLSISGYFLRAGNEEMKVKFATLTEHTEGVKQKMSIYNEVYEDFPLPVWQKVKRGNKYIMQYVNPEYVVQFGHLFDYDKHFQIGKSNFDLFPKKFAQKFYEDDVEVAVTGDKLEVVEEIICAENKPLYLKVIKWREVKNNKDTLVYGMVKKYYTKKPSRLSFN